MAGARHGYDSSVFINCPFDDDFRPLLEAMLFCIVDCGLTPRIASERMDGEARLGKIVELLLECRYSVHDLSRVKARLPGEFSRLNMPFELGLDFGLSQARTDHLAEKRLLVLGEEPYEYRVALSDIAGWDIRAHGGEYDQAIRALRNWLASLELTAMAASRITGDYVAFQEWDYERLLDSGWTEQDIQERPTPELLRAMDSWVEAGRPVTF